MDQINAHWINANINKYKQLRFILASTKGFQAKLNFNKSKVNQEVNFVLIIYSLFNRYDIRKRESDKLLWNLKIRSDDFNIFLFVKREANMQTSHFMEVFIIANGRLSARADVL